MLISSLASLSLPSISSPSRTRHNKQLLPPLPLSKPTIQLSRNHALRLKIYKHSSPRCNAQLLTDLAPATSAAYGALLLGGGLFAYVRSGSKGSIYGGATGAALMGLAYYLLQSSDTKELGEAIGFGAAFLFSCVFGIRLAATRKFIPLGLLLSLLVGALVVFYSAYMQAKV